MGGSRQEQLLVHLPRTRAFKTNYCNIILLSSCPYEIQYTYRPVHEPFRVAAGSRPADGSSSSRGQYYYSNIPRRFQHVDLHGNTYHNNMHV